MVELRLESIYDGTLPADCYVSVRVGETQKLSRLSGTRTYRFPTAADQHLGKIEVFKRVGACSINVDPANSLDREVRIGCGADIGTLGMRVHLEADQAAKQVQEEAATKKSVKMKAAKEYLSKHNLEVLLSEAMSAVLRERPDEPVDFILDQLKKGKSSMKAQNVAVSKRSAPEMGPYYPTYVLPGVGSDTWNDLYALFPEPNRSASVRLVEPAVKPNEVAYYKQNVLPACGSNVWSDLYRSFPQAKKMAQPQKGAYYKQNVLPGCGSDVWADLYGSFPQVKKTVQDAVGPIVATATAHAATQALYLMPSMGTWMVQKRRQSGPINAVVPALFAKQPAAAEVPAAVTTLVAARTESFKLLPSVGTWLGMHKRPVKMAPAPTTLFQLQPSVGTWLAPRRCAPGVVKAASPAATAATKPADYYKTYVLPGVSGETLNDLHSQFPAAVRKASGQASGQVWQKKPSIGTWLAPAPKAELVKLSRCFAELALPKAMTLDQRIEVERAATSALLEMGGDFAGEYFPLRLSTSFFPRPGGMSEVEEISLAQHGLLFKASEPHGCGVFATFSGDTAVWLNADDHHITFVARKDSTAPCAKVKALEDAVYDAICILGYTLV